MKATINELNELKKKNQVEIVSFQNIVQRTEHEIT